MDEAASYSMDRLELVAQLVASTYDRLVKAAIDEIKALPESCRQSGDDSDLKDVWEEFKYQLQREQGFFFAAYEQTIESICERLVADLAREQRQLLWLWTDAYENLWVDEDKVSIDSWLESDVVRELFKKVRDIAYNEELLFDPDEERAGERFEEDRRLSWGIDDDSDEEIPSDDSPDSP